MGLGLLLLFGGIALVDAGITGRDIRCLLRKVFDRSIDCPKATGGVSNFTPTTTPAPPAKPGTPFNDNDSVKNLAKANAVRIAIQARFPSAQFRGICNCRHQRGTGSDPNRWSVHSVCGAVDFDYSDPNAMIAFAKTLPLVWGAWLDASPGDIHIQVIPNPPANWVPPCATRKQPA